ncbi:GIY-YIG nuclease family protein [Weissella muntiaci]|uniref:GIY-YIG nuclease family protein n=1 Tax=Weissella muntiaci TaxID=2508881 RepID=A0A6C2C3F9_9LACO|nr:GIY-YIG nuclease family protein [Weissella muntiaci]TYC48073.1 GIY-YIG nuclease family protein [Weissella muntiaci]
MTKPYYMYVLLTATGTLYTGYTDDVGRRFATHQAGQGAKYTRPASRRPLKLLFAQAYESKHDAMSAEALFKRKRRTEKIAYLRANGVTDFTPDK